MPRAGLDADAAAAAAATVADADGLDAGLGRLAKMGDAAAEDGQ
jgi:hypothetical protein